MTIQNMQKLILVLIEMESERLIKEGMTQDEIINYFTPDKIRELYTKASDSFMLKMLKIFNNEEQRKDLVKHLYVNIIWNKF